VQLNLFGCCRIGKQNLFLVTIYNEGCFNVNEKFHVFILANATNASRWMSMWCLTQNGRVTWVLTTLVFTSYLGPINWVALCNNSSISSNPWPSWPPYLKWEYNVDCLKAQTKSFDVTTYKQAPLFPNYWSHNLCTISKRLHVGKFTNSLRKNFYKKKKCLLYNF
jgi:hypothetical protein